MTGVDPDYVVSGAIAPIAGLLIFMVGGITLYVYGSFNDELPPGLATTVVLIMIGIILNALFLGILGAYVGRIYQQTFVDTYSKVAFAKLYTTKTPITAADTLNDRVLPFFEQQALPMLRILTDRGTEYCGRVDQHDYQLYLAIVVFLAISMPSMFIVMSISHPRLRSIRLNLVWKTPPV